jgi:hypothetical protein
MREWRRNISQALLSAFFPFPAQLYLEAIDTYRCARMRPCWTFVSAVTYSILAE